MLRDFRDLLIVLLRRLADSAARLGRSALRLVRRSRRPSPLEGGQPAPDRSGAGRLGPPRAALATLVALGAGVVGLARSRPRTAGLLGALGLLALAAVLWRKGEEPIKAVARDYLAHRRVEKWEDVLLAASAESGVDPYLLGAIMFSESSGRVGVVSSAGAMGLFQVSRITADWRSEKMGIPTPTDEELLTDPLLNARLGADNVAWLLRTYDGDELRALCAYNAGMGLMGRLTEAEGGWEEWLAIRMEDGRSDILAYAQKVLRYRDEFRDSRLLEPDDAPASERGGRVR